MGIWAKAKIDDPTDVSRQIVSDCAGKGRCVSKFFGSVFTIKDLTTIPEVPAQFPLLPLSHQSPTSVASVITSAARHVPRSQKRSQGILDLQDPGSEILEYIGSSFLFSLGILGILNPVTATLPWDPRDFGSQTEKTLLDSGDPGSSLCELSWDLADLGSYKTTCHCILKILDIL